MAEFAASSFLSFLVIVDPVGLAPLFLGLTAGRSRQEQHRIALKAVLIAGILIITFGIGGRSLLGYLGVSIQSMTPDLAKALKVEGGEGALVDDGVDVLVAVQVAGDLVVEVFARRLGARIAQLQVIAYR